MANDTITVGTLVSSVDADRIHGNLSSAIRLTIPPTLLAGADEVIE